MAEETITILKVGTEEAVKSIADLRNNVKELKKILEDTQVDTQEGWEKYQETLDELKVNQNALKDAMYATTGTFSDVTKAATGASESYNSLVHRMAALKEEFRATNDAARRADLGNQIKAVNDQLKDLDALQGNFQRNVGNYAGSIKDAFKGLGDNVDALRKGLKITEGNLNGFKDGMEGLSKSPAIATFGILVSVALKLADELKDNETAMEGLKKAMAALQPVMDFFSGIIEKLALWLSDVISEVVEFVSSNGLINKAIKGVMGVGNAILQYVIAPFKGVIAAIKVFKEQGIKGLGDAAKAFGQEIKQGYSFKQNFQAGQAVAETFISGAKSKKKDVQAAGKEVADSFKEELKLEDWEKALAEGDKKIAEEKKARLEMQKSLDAEIQAEVDATNEAIMESYDEMMAKEEEERKKAEKMAKAKITTLQAVAGATSSILGSIADMYESDGEQSEKSAKKIKALRIASATIDTISGAIGAYMQAVATIPPPWGIIAGAANAAAVTAAGIAQISQIKNTEVSRNGGGTSVSSPAIAAAPTLTTQVSNVRTVTSASEEDRLNQMAQDQRVYILSSDIEASQNQIKTQVAESSF